ncbi:MAG TPA: long-chain-fatty-acid--CoA ligase, partial [Candidatus Rokubacteria bacterium]|nr:long-chain-fatty-acid--CoA ligase [Candidatus Rokubacteria bacterium]
FTPDGWLRSGDLGAMHPDGSIRFVERRKDVIVVSGFKAYPGEIEEVALRLPGVREAAAIGVADPHSGEAVKLFLVSQDSKLDVATVRAHCRAYLAAYKVPKSVEFRDNLPKTPVGKILRRALKEEAG